MIICFYHIGEVIDMDNETMKKVKEVIFNYNSLPDNEKKIVDGKIIELK